MQGFEDFTQSQIIGKFCVFDEYFYTLVDKASEWQGGRNRKFREGKNIMGINMAKGIVVI